jgi:hypothetical protein
MISDFIVKNSDYTTALQKMNKIQEIDIKGAKKGTY